MIRFTGQSTHKMGVADDVITAGYVAAPMISSPARKELIAGGVAGLVYDLFSQSSGSSSEQNGTHVGPGGTLLGNKAGLKSSRKMVKPLFRKGRDPCPPGYRLKTVNGKRMCVIQ